MALKKELFDHVATTPMGSYGSKHLPIGMELADKVDVNAFGEAILRACKGLSNPQV